MSTESKRDGKGPPAGPHFCLWVLWKREFRQTESGSSTVHNEFSGNRQRSSQLQHTRKSFERYVNSGRILQARIFEQPGNKTIESWREPFKNKGNANQSHMDTS